MKKTLGPFGLIFLILCFCLILGACENGDLPIDSSVVLACYGDSLTAGTSATRVGQVDKENAYPAFLQKKVRIKVENFGISGDTAGQALARIDDVLAVNPRIVIIELGANDFLSGISLATTLNNLDAIITMLSDGQRKIYLAKFYTDEVVRAYLRFMNFFGDTDPAEKKAQYDNIFSTLASRHDVELIEDIWTGVWGTEHMSPFDRIHPRASGYKIMADKYFEALRPYLAANNYIR